MRLPTTCGLLATAMLLAFCAAVSSVAGTDTGSSAYRVQGNVLPTAAGSVSGGQTKVYHIVGQPDPFGESEGEDSKVWHGWRIPPVIRQLGRYTLAAGWNLQGAPGISDRTIGEIFTGPAGAPIKIGSVQYASADGGAIVEADDADPLVANLAFWVFSYWGGTGSEFDTPGAHRPADGSRWMDDLAVGWNLYSPPYHVTVPQSSRIAVVWRWAPERHAYELLLPGAIMRPLEGYWLFKTPETR